MKKLKSQLNESEIIKDLFEKLISSEYHIFPARGKINITEKHGVYIIYNPNNEELHVGNTPSGRKGLNQRLYNHISCTGIFYEKYLARMPTKKNPAIRHLTRGYFSIPFTDFSKNGF